METIDSSIVNASLDEATFIITGYLTANVVVIPLTPWFAERFGRHQHLAVSILRLYARRRPIQGRRVAT